MTNADDISLTSLEVSSTGDVSLTARNNIDVMEALTSGTGYVTLAAGQDGS